MTPTLILIICLILIYLLIYFLIHILFYASALNKLKAIIIVGTSWIWFELIVLILKQKIIEKSTFETISLISPKIRIIFLIVFSIVLISFIIEFIICFIKDRKFEAKRKQIKNKKGK